MCLCVYLSLMPFLEFFSFCLVLLSYSNVLILFILPYFLKNLKCKYNNRFFVQRMIHVLCCWRQKFESRHQWETKLHQTNIEYFSPECLFPFIFSFQVIISVTAFSYMYLFGYILPFTFFLTPLQNI